MKIQFKLIPTLIMAAISILIGYAFYAANSSEWQKWFMFILAAVEFSILLIGGFGIKYADRGGANITVLSIVFTILVLIVQLISTFFKFYKAPYIIINGIIILIYLGITYALAKGLNS